MSLFSGLFEDKKPLVTVFPSQKVQLIGFDHNEKVSYPFFGKDEPSWILSLPILALKVLFSAITLGTLSPLN